MFSSSKHGSITGHSTKTDSAKRRLKNNNLNNEHHAAPSSQNRLAQLWAWISNHPKSIAAVILLISMTLFLTLNVNGHWDFALPLRGKKLLALMVVGYAIGVSTLLFQTLTHNPILTPSLLGFDSLYVCLLYTSPSPRDRG